MNANTQRQNKSVAIWLFVCCVMIALMVFIGGLTRLTESGLSMTDWKPVTGWLPPIGEEAWLEEFSRYRQSPEYQHKNFGFSLAEFQNIFWLEYIHRVLGRITGFVFFLPFLFFLYKKQLDRALILKLTLIFLLGATQAVVGWFMVKSGLKENPFVSPVWLSAHLGTAFLIFALVFWQALNKSCWSRVISGESDKEYGFSKTQEPSAREAVLQCEDRNPSREQSKEYRFSKIQEPSAREAVLQCEDRNPSREQSKEKHIKKFAWVVVIAIYLQILLGGMVAGSDAGWVYNTWPDMNGSLIPSGLAVMEPWYANPLKNTTMIQFNHRIGAYIVAGLVFVFALLLLRKSYKPMHKAAIALLSILAAQMVIGIKTLLYAVPIPLASLHQMVALALFSVAILILHKLYIAIPLKNVIGLRKQFF